MEIFVSIDGVLRNTIKKFDYHYKDYYFDSDVENTESTENFEYSITEPVYNDNLLNHYKFQTKEEFEYFLFFEFPIEIFGHAGVSYQSVISDLNNLIYNNPEHNFTVVGLDQLGKSKSATLFFLSKNGFLGNDIKFIKTSDISEMWGKCDVWITDSEKIITECPKEKNVIKFVTDYNQYFTNKKEITKLSEIQEPWNCLEKTTTLTLTESQTNAEQHNQ
jgi:hypothetical protein